MKIIKINLNYKKILKLQKNIKITQKIKINFFLIGATSS